MAFMLSYNLVFIDSFQFLSSSLDKLVNNLPKESFKKKMFIKIFGKIKINLRILIIQRTVHTQDKTNKTVIGKFKVKAAGQIITEFVGLRTKMFSYVKENGENNKTAKGIKNSN